MKVREKLFQLYQSLGINPDLGTFSKRKQLQKLTYLIEAFDINLGFRFSWYLHGPYDSRLTSVLYNDDKNESERPVEDHFKNEAENLRRLKEFLGSDINSSRSLELIGSLYHLLVVAKRTGKTEEDAVKRLLELKPHFEESEVRYYLKKIKETIPIQNH